MNKMKRNKLLLAITRCPRLKPAQADIYDPCHRIVCSQPADAFQAPEPWRGHIDTAPILFVSSNPSISGNSEFPPESWTDAQITGHYEGCFDRGAAKDVRPITDSEYNSVSFWREVRGRATEILGRPAVPGKDFALTELVHCKSKSEYGVAEALPECSNRWLSPVLHQSAATVIVLLGRYTKDYCTELWRLDNKQSVHFNVPIAGRERVIVILPHPNAREKRKVEHHASQTERERLRLLAVDTLGQR